jgi:hypothetical protein
MKCVPLGVKQPTNNQMCANRNIVKRDKMDFPDTQILDRSISWLGTIISIKSVGVKQVLWAQT